MVQLKKLHHSRLLRLTGRQVDPSNIGVLWVHCKCTPSRRREKKLGAKLTGESCKCTPPNRARVQIYRKLRRSGRRECFNLVVLAFVIYGHDEKGRQLFRGIKVHAPQKNSGYAYALQSEILPTPSKKSKSSATA